MPESTGNDEMSERTSGQVWSPAVAVLIMAVLGALLWRVVEVLS